ncbi:alcohol dehydrogenase catalytic domain-containing protein [Nocardia brasiliensis]|uniref:Dehydrogenase n=1 Tax=Nocardia brasiliensis (strain ATCC 700358 / HUJEG-1) TaxID=1133849 RepID=K0EXE8_NOCB7|nr:alcohol dehydrogenase catalytic domain-containing protein [Nocardia brasiliensis]AFU01555.1 dehydrogenase [Nocardia brasiliensis ATCC 700358]OCF85861.1 alcohol dehydrogenase [Nocardia brasiliensis]
MKALTYQGPREISYSDVPDPVLTGPDGVIIRVTAAGICGSDLHIYAGHGFTDGTGYSVGHEAVGEIVEIGSNVRGFAVGDRVLVPASAGCGRCANCRIGLVAACERTPAAIDACYGLGGALPGGQAEYLAVAHAEGNVVRLPVGVGDDAAVVLTDNAPTAWYGARRARIAPGETVVVIGLGPVGLMAVQSAFAMGASRVLGVDLIAERRKQAAELGAEPVDADDPKLAIRELLGGGADVAIEAVGADATIKLAISAVGHRGRVSVIGVSQNRAYPFHMPLAQIKELEFHIGLCSIQYELPTLLRLTAAGRLRPEAVITHSLPMSDGANAYRLFAERADGVSKVVLDPAR